MKILMIVCLLVFCGCSSYDGDVINPPDNPFWPVKGTNVITTTNNISVK